MEKKAPARGKKTRTQRIDEILYELEKVFTKDLDETTINVYHKILGPYSVEEISAACSTWLASTGDRKFDYFPRPNQIIEIIESKKVKGPRIEVRAQQQWRVILQQIKRHGDYHPPQFSDPITANLVKTQFSWSYLCNMEESEENWEQKRWCEAFVLAAELHKDLAALEVPEKVIKLLDGIGKEIPLPERGSVPVDKIKAYKETITEKAQADDAGLVPTNTIINARIEYLKKQAKEIAQNEFYADIKQTDK